jgi:glycosyltransferase involved in cell wall biosynthesis
VSTKLGAEGLGAAAGVELLLADRPEDFAASITKVLEDPALARGIGSAGRSLYERKFTWDAAWEVLDKMDLLQTVSDFGREQSADS